MLITNSCNGVLFGRCKLNHAEPEGAVCDAAVFPGGRGPGHPPWQVPRSPRPAELRRRQGECCLELKETRIQGYALFYCHVLMSFRIHE